VNLHPVRSYEGFFVPVPEIGEYQVQLSTDDLCFGGHGRVWHQSYATIERDGKTGILLYLPSRTGIILKKK
jgi:1,4-alpha-glucan branching enzyme